MYVDVYRKCVEMSNFNSISRLIGGTKNFEAVNLTVSVASKTV